MEEPQFSDSIAERTDMPEALNDPGEPVQPDIDEENATPNPPLAAPEQDMEATEAAPGTVQDDKGDVSDAESVLSEVDEAQFDNFNPEDVDIVDRPAPLDDTALGQIGVHKRKRTEGDGDGAGRKKKKETRREKPKKSRKRRGAEDESGDFVEGGEVGETRSRKRGERKPKAQVPDEDWENMDPKERRRRELDMKMDAALKSSSNRRSRKTGIDLEAAADAEVEDMRIKMTKAAQADNEGRQTGQPAQYKLKLLPEVVALLNRNTLQNSIIDPETNLLEAVRFFLEPLSDGSLPAYNIQREIFTALAKLPVTKEALISSSIGKVVLFYTKSKRPEPSIKRMAEKLIGDWTRPILKRTDDYRKKEFQEARFDPMHLPVRSSQAMSSSQNGSIRPTPGMTTLKSARPVQAGAQSYSVVPRSSPIVGNAEARNGAARSEMAKQLKLGKAGGRR